MRRIKEEINLFKIKNEAIPEKVFLFELFLPEVDNKDERIRKVKKDYKAVPIKLEGERVTAISFSKSEKLKDVESLSLDEFLKKHPDKTEKIEELVASYFRWERDIERDLAKSISQNNKKILDQINNENGDFLVYCIPKRRVCRIEDSFYYVIDMKYQTIAREPILSDLMWGVPKEYFIGTEVIYKNPEGKKFEIEILDIFEDDEKLKEIRKYLREHYNGYTPKNEKQPLIKGRFTNNRKEERLFLAEMCYKVWRGRNHQKFITSNLERRKILCNSVKPILILEKTPKLANGYQFPEVEYRVKDRNRKEKFLKKIGNDFKERHIRPFFVPEQLREKKVQYLVLVHKKMKRKERIFKLLEESFKFKYSKKEEIDLSNINEVLHKVGQWVDSHKINFVLMVVEDNPKLDFHYEELKRRLFERNILSQVFKDTTVLDRSGKVNQFALQNIRLNIYSKLGVRHFSLKEPLNYDLIVGIDVGKGRFGKLNVGGCVTAFTNDGIIETLIPTEIETNGERIELLNEVLRKLFFNLNLKGGKILLLRDGMVRNGECKALIQDPELKNFSFRFLNIKKSSPFRVFTRAEEGGKGFLLRNDLGILLPHSHKAGRPIVVDQSVLIENGEIKNVPITYSDLYDLYKLTKLNYSTLFGELRLPAPVHYADLFVKALGKGWRVDRELLNMGCLYFI
jgi:argonaute family protein